METLAAQGVVAKPAAIEASSDRRCLIAQPVTLEALTLRGGQRVDLPDRPTVACITAATFANFTNELLVPLAKGAFDASIIAIGTGPGFECRTRDHVVGAKLSAHATGLAIDIAEIKFTGGRTYQVGKMADETERGFDRAARSAACGYFHTALGPGSDAFHANHWHFDLEPRGSDGTSKFCQ
ncbi:MAG: extensin family protein [Methylocella sp.]